MKTRMIVLLTTVAAVCLTVRGGVLYSQDAVPAGDKGDRATEAIRLERMVKKRYMELIRIMHEVAQSLMKADPNTALAVETAAQKAEEALIAEDMDKVVALLQGGLIVPADATQAKIVDRLRQVLKALQGGDELEWKLFVMEQLKEQMEALRLLVGRQRRLERMSYSIAFGDEVKSRISAVKARIDPVAALQKDLIKRSEDLPEEPIAAQIGNAKSAVDELLRRFGVHKPRLSSAYPSPDDMAANAIAARAIESDTIRARTEVKTALNAEGVKQALDAAGFKDTGTRVPRSLDEVVAELQRAAKGFSSDALEEARVAFAQAESLAAEAAEELKRAMFGLPGMKAMNAVIAEQEKIARDFKEMGAAVQEVAPLELAYVRDQVKPLAIVITPFPPPGGADGKAADAGAPAISSLVAALYRYDRPSAVFEQQRNLEFIGQWRDRLQAALNDVDDLQRNPRYTEQKHDQEGIVTDLRKVLDRTSALRETLKKEAQIEMLPGELRTAMESASDSGKKAAGFLGNEKPVDANPEQKEVIRLLTKVMDQMESINGEFHNVMLKELLEQWTGLVQRLIMKQKMCSAETVEIAKKRKSDQSFERAEQLRLGLVARTQEGMIKETASARELCTGAGALVKSHGTPGKGARYGAGIAPLLLELVKGDLPVVVKRLNALDPGSKTQALQKEILERLELILAAAKDDSNNPAPSSPMAWNTLCGPQQSLPGRVTMLRMLMGLQTQLNRKTQELHEQRGIGMPVEELEKEISLLVKLEGDIRAEILKYTVLDAESWVTK